MCLCTAVLIHLLSFSWPNTGSGAQASYGRRGLWRHSELQVVWQPPSHPHLDQEGLQHGENKPSNLPLTFDLEPYILYNPNPNLY